jgi:transposase-like protein
LGLAFYIRLSSLRRAARALSEIHKVSKTAACEWVRRFSGKVNVNPCLGGLTVLGEVCVKVNGLEYWVYAALDVDRNENHIHDGSPIRKCVSSRAIHT